MKVTVKHWLMANPEYDGTLRYGLYPFNMSSAEDYVVVKTMDVDLDIPDDFDPRKGLIAGLEAKKQKARADFELLMTTLDGKIQQLKCIEHRGE